METWILHMEDDFKRHTPLTQGASLSFVLKFSETQICISSYIDCGKFLHFKNRGCRRLLSDAIDCSPCLSETSLQVMHCVCERPRYVGLLGEGGGCCNACGAGNISCWEGGNCGNIRDVQKWHKSQRIMTQQ